jgi:hypothetical protein
MPDDLGEFDVEVAKRVKELQQNVEQALKDVGAHPLCGSCDKHRKWCAFVAVHPLAYACEYFQRREL